MKLYSKGKICKHAIEVLLERKSLEVTEEIKRMSKEELKEKIKELIEKGFDEERIVNEIMKNYRLRVEAEDLKEAIKELK